MTVLSTVKEEMEEIKEKHADHSLKRLLTLFATTSRSCRNWLLTRDGDTYEANWAVCGLIFMYISLNEGDVEHGKG